MTHLDPKDFASLELADSNLREIELAVARALLELDGVSPPAKLAALDTELRTIRLRARRGRELVADVNVKRP